MQPKSEPEFFDNEGQSCPICAHGVFEVIPYLEEMISMVGCTHCEFQVERYSEVSQER